MSKESKSLDDIFARLDSFFERQTKEELDELQERINNAKEETIDESCEDQSTHYQLRNSENSTLET